MSLFESIGDIFFGGQEKDAQESAEKGLENAGRSLADATATARGEAKALYGDALEQTTEGFQRALDLWDRIGSRQARTVTSGNRAGQQQILAGLQEAHRNLLGAPMDYSRLAPPNVWRNFNFDNQLPTPLDPVTDLVDQRGVPFELQNIPPEAGNIVGMLRDGNITYQEAADWLSTGAGYGSFGGLPRSTINQLIANFVPGGSRYSEATDLNKVGRDPYTDAQDAWRVNYG